MTVVFSKYRFKLKKANTEFKLALCYLFHKVTCTLYYKPMAELNILLEQTNALLFIFVSFNGL